MSVRYGQGVAHSNNGYKDAAQAAAGLFAWQRTQEISGVRLDVYATPQERTYYLLRNTNEWRKRTLLELTIDPDGRKIDYLKLDRFWGRVPRPILG